MNEKKLLSTVAVVLPFGKAPYPDSFKRSFTVASCKQYSSSALELGGVNARQDVAGKRGKLPLNVAIAVSEDTCLNDLDSR